MKKTIFLGILVLIFPISAQAQYPEVKTDFLDRAKKISEEIFDLGEARDPRDGRALRGYAILHKTTGRAFFDFSPDNSSGDCYAFLSEGAKWESPAPWRVNPKNPSGIPGETVFQLMKGAMNEWEDADDGIIDGSIGRKIFGDGMMTSELLYADESAPNGKNEVYFGELPDKPDTIALTIVWTSYSSETDQVSPKGIREWDQIYNTKFAWSAEEIGVPDKIDFSDITTHELGHALGLADLYDKKCQEETMYGKSSYGETKKRTLAEGDIKGVYLLYSK